MFANRSCRLFLIGALTTLSALILFGPPSGAQDGETAGGPYPDLSELEPDTVVAVVNDNPISFGQVEYAYTLLPGDLGARPLAQILPQVVQLVVEQRLLAEEAVSQGIHQQASYQAALQFQADRLLQERFIRNMMAEQLSEEALEIAYTVFSMKLPLEERVQARHILIAPESNDEADVRDALSLAQDVIRQLNQGADFSDLAERYSADEETANQGGDLGFFPRGRMVEPFEQAAFALDMDTFTQEAVTTPFGFHIIEVLDRTEMKPTLDDVRDQLINQLETQRLSLVLQELRAKAEIQTIIEPLESDR